MSDDVKGNSLTKPSFDSILKGAGGRENEKKLVARRMAEADDRNLGNYLDNDRDVK